ncbi:MAG: hypothetical protein HY517_02925 [Candidatus Aenigmarchaeota archaeon]|nr:hypothetical protein [Candidatus Aenigmarchaeota archaeon]
MHNIAYWLIITIVVLSIVLAVDQRLIASEKIKEVREEITERFTLKIEDADYIGNAAPAKITSYDLLPDGQYEYDLKISPRIGVSGKHQADVGVITLIKFKGKSSFAKICQNGICDKDSFTIKSDDSFVEPIISASIRSDTPPIVSEHSIYTNDKFREDMPVFVQSDSSTEPERSGLLIEVFLSREYDLGLPDTIKNLAFTCRAEFSLRCANSRIFTSYLTDPAGKPGDYMETRNMCGGAATVRIRAKPDCLERQVSTEIEYNGGKQWAPGEEIHVSFWRETDCTRKTSANLLFFKCAEYEKDGKIMHDLIGGEEKLNAGLLQ